MTLTLRSITSAGAEHARQLAMPWQPVRCADAAAMAGWTWHRMARAIRRHARAARGSSMRGVRVTPDQVAEISANSGKS
jgi:hypothetical protein